MTVKVTGAISTTSPSDVYPTHLAELGKGGMRSVNLLADLDLIPVDRREIGMLVYVVEDDTTYQLTQTGWKIFKDVLVFDELAAPGGATMVNFGTIGDVEDATGLQVATAVNALIDQGAKKLLPDLYIKLPSIYSLYLRGVGSVSISGKDFSGNTANSIAVYNVSSDIIVYPIFTGQYSISAVCTGTASAEVI